jgi:hypothetical protein
MVEVGDRATAVTVQELLAEVAVLQEQIMLLTEGNTRIGRDAIDGAGSVGNGGMSAMSAGRSGAVGTGGLFPPSHGEETALLPNRTQKPPTDVEGRHGHRHEHEHKQQRTAQAGPAARVEGVVQYPEVSLQLPSPPNPRLTRRLFDVQPTSTTAPFGSGSDGGSVVLSPLAWPISPDGGSGGSGGGDGGNGVALGSEKSVQRGLIFAVSGDVPAQPNIDDISEGEEKDDGAMGPTDGTSASVASKHATESDSSPSSPSPPLVPRVPSPRTVWTTAVPLSAVTAEAGIVAWVKRYLAPLICAKCTCLFDAATLAVVTRESRDLSLIKT